MLPRDFFISSFLYILEGSTKTSRDVMAMTEEGLNFLQERSLFWESLGPLPPPLPQRRAHRIQKMSNLTSVGSLENITGSMLAVSESLRPGPPTNIDSPVPPDESTVNFDFKSYRPSSSLFGSGYVESSSDFAMYSEEPIYPDAPASELESWRDTDTEISAQEQRKRDIAVYFTKESDSIEQCKYLHDIFQIMYLLNSKVLGIKNLAIWIKEGRIFFISRRTQNILFTVICRRT